MKNTIYLFILILGVPFHMSAQLKSSNWKLENLNGKVKSVSEKTFQFVKIEGVLEKGKSEKRSQYDFDFEMKFDTLGNLVEKTVFYNKDTIYFKRVYKVNTNGRTDRILTYTSSSYAEKRRHIEPIFTKMDSSFYLSIISDFKFDRKNRLETISSKNVNTGITDETKYKYDKENRIIERRNLSGGKYLMYMFKYFYNDSGEKIRTEQYFLDEDKIQFSYLYNYDEQGNNIQQLNYDSYSDLNGNYKYKYDAYRNLVSEIGNWFNGDKDVYIDTSFNYEYDVLNNWTSMIKYEMGKPSHISERQIEYYK